MSQTTLGAKRLAAKRYGLTLEEYLRHILLDLAHCGVCKEWKPRSSFPRDCTRNDGLARRCKPCCAALHRAKYVRKRPRRPS